MNKKEKEKEEYILLENTKKRRSKKQTFQNTFSLNSLKWWCEKDSTFSKKLIKHNAFVETDLDLKDKSPVEAANWVARDSVKLLDLTWLDSERVSQRERGFSSFSSNDTTKREPMP